MNVVISGGGIAGLSTGILLSQMGFNVDIFEISSSLRDLGTGVQISPNGYRVLQLLNVEKEIAPHIFEPENIHIRDGLNGSTHLSFPIKEMTKNIWGGKYLNIKRFDLSKVLLDELNKQKSAKIHFSKNIINYRQTKKDIVAISEDGSCIPCDVLIAADGTFSKIRQQMLPKEKINYTGNFAWRALVDTKDINDQCLLKNNCIWTGPRKHAVTTILKKGSLINFVGVIKGSQKKNNLNFVENKQFALNDFNGWNHNLVSIIESAKKIHKWPIYSALPFKRWTDQNVVLIGDAAHPMAPSMAQGAVQALEDSAILAKQLQGNSTTYQSLYNFHKVRLPRTSRIQKLSKKNIHLFHLPNRFLVKIMYLIIRILTWVIPNLLQKRFDWIYKFSI